VSAGFAGPQIAEVVERERPVALIYDAEFGGLIREAGRRRERFIAWHDGDEGSKATLREDLIAAGDPGDLAPPPEPGSCRFTNPATG
jgi:hypothetical protein